MLGRFINKVLVVSFLTLSLIGVLHIPNLLLKYPVSIDLPLISMSVEVAS